MERGVLVQTGSWPCENFSGRATRRNISEQLHLWESNHTAHARFDALLENCVFYISRMYEFSHSVGHSATSTDVRYTAASLIGRQGQALSGHPPLRCQCRSRALASLRTRHQGPSIMGFEDEVEQSFGRPCRQCDCRFKRLYELTSSIVPRGTSFNRWADLRFSRI